LREHTTVFLFSITGEFEKENRKRKTKKYNKIKNTIKQEIKQCKKDERDRRIAKCYYCGKCTIAVVWKI